MSKPVIWAFSFLAVVPGAKAEVEIVVELVPEHSAPYTAGGSLTVDVWLHSRMSFDAPVWHVQLDFSDSDPALVLDPTFMFDLSSSIAPEDFEVHPDLPIPWTANRYEYGCPECRLQLPEGGSLHIGSIGIRFPGEPGTYRLDVLNADDPDQTHGAWVDVDNGSIWRAFTGEITGGAFDFLADPPIPTLSEWGLAVMGSLLLGVGCWTIVRRTQQVKAGVPYGDEIRVPSHAGCQGGAPRVCALTAICSAGVSLAVTTRLTRLHLLGRVDR